jgi:hypothetical protein
METAARGQSGCENKDALLDKNNIEYASKLLTIHEKFDSLWIG